MKVGVDIYHPHFDKKFASSLNDADRLEHLKRTIVNTTKQFPVGNTLNLKKWATFVSDEDLKSLRDGYQIPLEHAPQGLSKNHPSLNENAEVAHAEWKRLEKLGKI